eukprot:gene4766-315_t
MMEFFLPVFVGLCLLCLRVRPSHRPRDLWLLVGTLFFWRPEPYFGAVRFSPPPSHDVPDTPSLHTFTTPFPMTVADLRRRHRRPKNFTAVHCGQPVLDDHPLPAGVQVFFCPPIIGGGGKKGKPAPKPAPKQKPAPKKQKRESGTGATPAAKKGQKGNHSTAPDEVTPQNSVGSVLSPPPVLSSLSSLSSAEKQRMETAIAQQAQAMSENLVRTLFSSSSSSSQRLSSGSAAPAPQGSSASPTKSESSPPREPLESSAFTRVVPSSASQSEKDAIQRFVTDAMVADNIDTDVHPPASYALTRLYFVWGHVLTGDAWSAIHYHRPMLSNPCMLVSAGSVTKDQIHGVSYDGCKKLSVILGGVTRARGYEPPKPVQFLYLAEPLDYVEDAEFLRDFVIRVLKTELGLDPLSVKDQIMDNTARNPLSNQLLREGDFKDLDFRGCATHVGNRIAQAATTPALKAGYKAWNKLLCGQGSGAAVRAFKTHARKHGHSNRILSFCETKWRDSAVVAEYFKENDEFIESFLLEYQDPENPDSKQGKFLANWQSKVFSSSVSIYSELAPMFKSIFDVGDSLSIPSLGNFLVGKGTPKAYNILVHDLFADLDNFLSARRKDVCDSPAVNKIIGDSPPPTFWEGDDVGAAPAPAPAPAPEGNSPSHSQMTSQTSATTAAEGCGVCEKTDDDFPKGTPWCDCLCCGHWICIECLHTDYESQLKADKRAPRFCLVCEDQHADWIVQQYAVQNALRLLRKYWRPQPEPRHYLFHFFFVRVLNPRFITVLSQKEEAKEILKKHCKAQLYVDPSVVINSYLVHRQRTCKECEQIKDINNDVEHSVKWWQLHHNKEGFREVAARVIYLLCVPVGIDWNEQLHSYFKTIWDDRTQNLSDDNFELCCVSRGNNLDHPLMVGRDPWGDKRTPL